ncbi:MAG: M1 family metallopeptidase [Chloroflexi bacterium]|nr:M1 family metallopeptidase [Chloroflexota bacterium]
MNRVKSLGRILIVLLTALISLGLPSISSAAGNTTYEMHVKLDFPRSQLNVVEKVVYVNKTGTSLSSVGFNVSPAHFKAFKLISARVGGQDVDWLLEDVSLDVVLPQSLDPGEFADIELRFDLDVPSIGGRFGTYDHVMALGNWFPLVSIYRDGWDKHTYTPFGDPFISEVADYQVTVQSQTDVEIAHTGSLIKREGNTWQIKAENVRDFAMAVSDRYETKSTNVDGITVTAYNARGNSGAASLYLEATSQAVKWLNQNIGKYPYDSLKVVEVSPGKEDMVGQEYPNLVFISSAYSAKPEGVKSYSGYLIVHEIGHQWFYGLVGNDQMKEPWLDEALVTYLAYRVLDWAPLSLSSPAVSPSGQSPVNSTVYDFKDETQYSATAYGKGTVFLQDVAGVLKGDGIEGVLREYLDLYKHKIATTRGLLSLMQSRASTSLNPLFRRYFSFPEYKSDTPLKVDFDWPQGDAWTGTASIGYRGEAPIKRIEVYADGLPLLKTSSPSSPISVDVSNLVDGEYVVEVAAFDDGGRVTEGARRVKVSGGLSVRPMAVKSQPTPTATPVGYGIAAPFNVQVQLPDYTPNLDAPITLDTGKILMGIAGLAGVFVVLVLFVAIQSRRSWKSDFQFTGSKLAKYNSRQGLPLRQESVPVVKAAPSPASSIVAEIVTRHHPPSGNSDLPKVDSAAVAPTSVEPEASLAPIRCANGVTESEDKGNKGYCRLEGFARSERDDD